MSPRPRYQKLPEEKRQSIMDAAATEFAKFGFEGASLNKIIARAGISKGATYYYFDDKADLFATVTDYLLSLMDKDSKIESWGDTGDFWGDTNSYIRRTLRVLRKIPWAKGMIHALVSYVRTNSDAPTVQAAMEIGRRFGSRIVERGQEMGEIRDDLPHDLLVDLILALDFTIDRWALENLDFKDEKAFDEWGSIFGDLLRRMLERRE